MKGEQFECANCFRIVTLDEHGRCEHCGSLAVMSLERVEVLVAATQTIVAERAARL
jgi:rRNA maturation endonuclease Nob1